MSATVEKWQLNRRIDRKYAINAPLQLASAPAPRTMRQLHYLAPTMTEDEFYLFLDESVFALEQKQARLQTDFNMGSQARWWFDQQVGTLKFFDDPKQAIELEAQVVVLGTFAPEHSTWKWGWANQTLSQVMRDAATPLKDLATITSVDFFSDPEEFVVEQGMEWELTAMAVAHLNLLGAYRAPSSLGKHHTFLGIVRVGTGSITT